MDALVESVWLTMGFLGVCLVVPLVLGVIFWATEAIDKERALRKSFDEWRKKGS